MSERDVLLKIKENIFEVCDDLENYWRESQKKIIENIEDNWNTKDGKTFLLVYEDINNNINNILTKIENINNNIINIIKVEK